MKSVPVGSGVESLPFTFLISSMLNSACPVYWSFRLPNSTPSSHMTMPLERSRSTSLLE